MFFLKGETKKQKQIIVYFDALPNYSIIIVNSIRQFQIWSFFFLLLLFTIIFVLKIQTFFFNRFFPKIVSFNRRYFKFSNLFVLTRNNLTGDRQKQNFTFFFFLFVTLISVCVWNETYLNDEQNIFAISLLYFNIQNLC